MWTNENRARYDRSKLRYPSDVTDAEWALIEPLIPPAKRGGGKRTVVMRAVVNRLMYALSTRYPWRAIPKDLPPKSTVYGYFDLWTYDGTLDRIHHALYVKCREPAGREASPTAAVLDSRSVKSAGKGGIASIRMATMQEKRSRQEAAYSRRYDRPAASCACSCCRHSGSRWRRSCPSHDVREIPVFAKAVCRLSGPAVPRRAEECIAVCRYRDRQALGCGQRFRGAASSMGRRKNLFMARSLPKAGQGLRKPQSQRAGVSAPRHLPHAQKSL